MGPGGYRNCMFISGTDVTAAALENLNSIKYWIWLHKNSAQDGVQSVCAVRPENSTKIYAANITAADKTGLVKGHLYFASADKKRTKSDKSNTHTRQQIQVYAHTYTIILTYW